MKILVRKTVQGLLAPTDEAGAEALRKWKAGDELWCEFRKPRFPKHHKLYFALLNIVYENQERYTSFEMFRKAVQVAAGHFDMIYTVNGEGVVSTKSIDYSSLDQVEFDRVFGEVMRVCLDNFMEGTDEAELRAEVERHAA